MNKLLLIIGLLAALLPMRTEAQGVRSVILSQTSAGGASTGEPQQPPPGGEDYATLDLALASVTASDVGQTVTVGGTQGGTFLVTDDGALPDSGLVFAPYEAVSSPVTEVLPNAQTTRYFGLHPDGQDVVYGSLTLDLLDPVSDEPIFTAEDKHLHGIGWISPNMVNMVLDYEEGSLSDPRERMKNHCASFTSDVWSCDLRFTYRHTTSDLRLRRLGVGSTLNVDWFGARTYDEDPAFDNQPIIVHAIKVADRLNAETPGSVTTILLPRLAVYEYFGTIRLSEGLTLKGGGGTEVVTVTNDLGQTYSPVRLKAARTTLRVKTNEALTHIRMMKDPADPYYLAPDVKRVLGDRQTAIYLAPGVVSAGVEDLFLDGNWEGNQQAFTEGTNTGSDGTVYPGWATHDEKETWMRNSPGWSGIVSTNHNGVNIPVGQHITLRNVAVMGYGATNLLGDIDNTWTAENVRVGDVLWNHSIYGANGTYTNLTVSGFAWGHMAFYAGDLTNLVYEDMMVGPYRHDEKSFDIRGGDTYSDEEAFIRSDGTPLKQGVRIDGFFFDLRGGDLFVAFSGLGPRMEIRNGVVVDDGGVTLFQENGNGNQTALYPDYRIENVEMYGAGGIGPTNLQRGLFRNIRSSYDLVGDVGSREHGLRLNAGWRNHPAWDTVQVTVFDGVRLDSRVEYLAHTSVTTNLNAVGADYFILNSRFNNQNNTLFRTIGENGDFDLLRVYFDSTEVKIHGNYFQNLFRFLSVGRFKDVTDTNSGRVSESEGTVSFTATAGQTYVDVSPNLFWVPVSEEYVTYSGAGAGLIASVVPVCSGNVVAFELPTVNVDRRGCDLRFNFAAPLSAGQAVAFDWTAAVHPWEEGVTVPEYAQ